MLRHARVLPAVNKCIAQTKGKNTTDIIILCMFTSESALSAGALCYVIEWSDVILLHLPRDNLGQRSVFRLNCPKKIWRWSMRCSFITHCPSSFVRPFTHKYNRTKHVSSIILVVVALYFITRPNHLHGTVGF